METDKANPNSRNQVRNETNFAFNQQNIKCCLSILGTRAWTPRCYRMTAAPTKSQNQLRRLYRNSLLKRFRKEDSIDSNSKQLQDPCRISAVTSMKIGSVARPSRHSRGACSWQPLWPTRTYRIGSMAWTGACAKGHSQLPLYIFTQLSHRRYMQIRLVSDKKVKRHQRLTYRTMQRRLNDLWK